VRLRNPDRARVRSEQLPGGVSGGADADSALCPQTARYYLWHGHLGRGNSRAGVAVGDCHPQGITCGTAILAVTTHGRDARATSRGTAILAVRAHNVARPSSPRLRSLRLRSRFGCRSGSLSLSKGGSPAEAGKAEASGTVSGAEPWP